MANTRAFNIRTKGLFKKGNTLFNLLQPRVLIFVAPDHGPVQGYASHTPEAWPQLQQLLSALGLASHNLLGPDHFDTVADRLGDSSESFRSQSPSTPPQLNLAVNNDENDRYMAEILKAALDGDTTLTSTQPILQNTQTIIPPQSGDGSVSSLSLPGGPQMLWSAGSSPEPMATKTRLETNSSWLPTDNTSRSQHEGLGSCFAGVKKRRRAPRSSRHTHRQHKVITRSST